MSTRIRLRFRYPSSRLRGQQPFEGGVPAFEVLERFRVVDLQAAELVTLAVIGRFRETQLVACRRGVLALSQQPIGRISLEGCALAGEDILGDHTFLNLGGSVRDQVGHHIAEALL